MKDLLCFIDLGTATQETRDPGGSAIFDSTGFLFG
jgi:hypothetical protein